MYILCDNVTIYKRVKTIYKRDYDYDLKDSPHYSFDQKKNTRIIEQKVLKVERPLCPKNNHFIYIHYIFMYIIISKVFFCNQRPHCKCIFFGFEFLVDNNM